MTRSEPWVCPQCGSGLDGLIQAEVPEELRTWKTEWKVIHD